MRNQSYLKKLEQYNSFTRKDLYQTMYECGEKVSEALLKVKLQELLKTGQIIRVGRNAYCVPPDGIDQYKYQYSELSKDVAKVILEAHPYLAFSVFEIVQLNEFVNHQLVHNIVFVSVESDLGDFVFDTLKTKYPGKVLLNPTVDIFHRYWYDGMIVIEKMVTEAPRKKNRLWATRLEKLLVDLLADSLLKNSISETEYPGIYVNAFQKYVIDESSLFRYAKRRGIERKLLDLIYEKTNIQLRTRR